ncbi:MAG: type II toxin-antitoxin system VapC family toxin [Pseudonocardia sp.]
MIVVDASALIDALIDDGPGGDGARAVLTDDPEWAAPPHLLVEVLSVIRRRVLRGEVKLDRAMEVVDALDELEILWVDPVTVVARIWELRDNVAAFDAAYVAAAELLECALITGDRRLAAATGPRCPIRPIA